MIGVAHMYCTQNDYKGYGIDLLTPWKASAMLMTVQCCTVTTFILEKSKSSLTFHPQSHTFIDIILKSHYVLSTIVLLTTLLSQCQVMKLTPI